MVCSATRLKNHCCRLQSDCISYLDYMPGSLLVLELRKVLPKLKPTLDNVKIHSLWIVILDIVGILRVKSPLVICWRLINYNSLPRSIPYLAMIVEHVKVIEMVIGSKLIFWNKGFVKICHLISVCSIYWIISSDILRMVIRPLVLRLYNSLKYIWK